MNLSQKFVEIFNQIGRVSMFKIAPEAQTHEDVGGLQSQGVQG